MLFPEDSGVKHGQVEVLHCRALLSVGSVDRAVVGASGGFELAHSLPELVAIASVVAEFGGVLGR